MGQRAPEAQPFSALMGARSARLVDGEAVLEVPMRKELLQQDGFVHGGVISYPADNAPTFAGGSVLGPEVLTQEYKIKYPGHPAGGRSWRGRRWYPPAKDKLCGAATTAPPARTGERRSARQRMARSPP
jgi:acyl-coenzyme A thioesterase PaaI-like protein